MLAIVAIAAGAPTPGHAQGGGDPWAGVEEMVVTGSGGVAALVEAPTSVAAFDDAELSKIGALNISDLAEYTPNLEINSPYAASNPQLFIRGVGLQDSNSNASSAVAVVVDNVYINSPAGQLLALRRRVGGGTARSPGRDLRPQCLGRCRAGEYAAAGPRGEGRCERHLRPLQSVRDRRLPERALVQDLLATRFAFKYVTRDPLGENRCFADRDNPFPRPTRSSSGRSASTAWCARGVVAAL
ncbi:MAG: Plug domain-containing protein [Myxococcota bacterium]